MASTSTWTRSLKLIDANVVIYSIGRSHEYREPSRRVMILAGEGQLEATLDTEALQEIIHFYHRRGRTETALAVFDDLMRTFPVPLGVTARTVVVARDILSAYSSLQARDAVHAAIVLEHGLEGIITADRGFDGIEGVARFDPKEFA